MKNLQQNMLVGYGLLAVIGLSIVTTLFESSISVQTTQNLFTIAGIGFFVFGIWAAVLLLKKKK